MRAAAVTHAATGLPIAAHTGDGIAAHAELDILERAGVPLSSFIWVHAHSEQDAALHLRAAERGAWVEFDGIAPKSVDRHVALVLAMRKAGRLDHVLVSHDAGWYRVGEADGGELRPFDTLHRLRAGAERDRRHPGRDRPAPDRQPAPRPDPARPVKDPSVRTSTLIAAALCLPAVLLAQGGGWKANPDLVAKLSKQRADANYDEAKVPPYTLPDLLAGKKGAVKTPEDWPARRAEILDLFRDTVYGRSPGKPDKADVYITHNPGAMDGDAAHRLVGIVSEHAGKTHTFELSLFLPNTVDKAPVFLFINNRAPSLTDPTRKEKSGFWPAEQLIARGYGMATFHYATVAPDDKDTFRTGAMQLYEGGGSQPTCALALAWARAGRGLLGTDPASTPSASPSSATRAAQGGAVGRRRGPLFAMVVSNESGEGGAA